MAATLPSEILCMVLDYLGDEKDYNSLYQCALSSKLFTEHALSALYRIYDASPLRGGGTEDEQLRAQTRKPVYSGAKEEHNSSLRKWITLWRSIVLSTLDLTYLPYYSYIRYLDLDDLGNLLGSGPSVKEQFFTRELLEFVSHERLKDGNKRRRVQTTAIDNEWIKRKLGSVIVNKNAMIRGMSCDIAPVVLNEWIEVSPQLQSLTVWSGSTLSQQAGEKIREHCPDFRQLRIYIWQDKPPGNAEIEAEELFNALRPNSLEYFEVLSFSHLGPRSMSALRTQKDSLTELKLTSLNIETIRELASLGPLPKLEVLSLTDSAPAAWDEPFYETLDESADWIGTCTKLKRLEVRRFMHDSRLLSKVLMNDNIHLTSLSFAGFRLQEGFRFLYDLKNHRSLQYLYLRGEGSPDSAQNNLLVESVGDLHELRELELKDVSDFFTMEQAGELTMSLPSLERLWISGEAFNDSIWPAFSCLSQLKSLAIYALSNFTAGGVIDFISQLGPGNYGLSLSILNATSAVEFPGEMQVKIREILAGSLEGSFDFGLAQEEFSDPDSEIELSD
ncbi:hypothetical protein AN5933.2 [Aspergillus nidulans FGSC A4]|uniref:F-box domain-containing protein n=1 Tax=Emericella nidulans (strain FGSC A4 / ATCC 38163 / CBS 112.46 / NRRL 194 / M139) TaxID=227321 RepID=Q5B0J7_EMENI|nr:hypothetical protein [Aspergillus nidulans FGSC A4]EAA57796.1 hypothetical protein AN5933.2 [Aspergillus nidulans FGSC A4]CBF70537.1 TPA: conserved hypothetical protein [Aspergillus nidulans FGSC A4]|eukprot:XP_663537.1 hypothetical protein AN5933.2 [Aspergillus nidulans FGSC A4]